MNAAEVLESVQALSAEFSRERDARRHRRELASGDFERLRDTGFLLAGVPTEMGGTWESIPRSTRATCEMVRALARADSSVALVSAMHPGILGFWLATPRADEPYGGAWEEQRRQVFRIALDGGWWGTMNSEPGSGGDPARTRTTARKRPDGAYLLSGVKQFASGAGITSYMLTIAIPEGEEKPDLFFVELRGAPWDGSAGLELIGPWDGHGMIATQSHGFRFDDFPAVRFAWPGNAAGATSTWSRPQPFIRCLFTSVCIGILDVAMATARKQLAARGPTLRPFEQVEWTRVEMEGWLALQAYEGMLRAVETETDADLCSLKGKTAVAELAELVTTRLCRVMGGGSYSRSSPFGFWAQDVRALGFLRPPWALAFDYMQQGVVKSMSE